MSDATDDDNLSELLDDDKLPADYPPDRPLGVDQYGVTAAEETVPEPLDERVRRELPDEVPDLDAEEDLGAPVGTLVEPDQGMVDVDDVAEAVALEADAPLDLDQLDADDVAFGDDTLRDVAQERVADVPAEEAAMHITAPPPMGDGDGYLEDDQ